MVLTDYSIQLQEECKQWYQEQIKYRQEFSKLFFRYWQLSPSISKEIYAFPAFKLLENNIKNLPERRRTHAIKHFNVLKPVEFPNIKLEVKNIKNTGLQISVDNSLELASFYTIFKNQGFKNPSRFISYLK